MKNKAYHVYGRMQVFYFNEHDEQYSRIDGIPPTVTYDGKEWEVVV